MNSTPFIQETVRAREVWGRRDAWKRDASGDCLADRAWLGLVTSAASYNSDNWTRLDQVALEAAEHEYRMRSNFSLRLP